MDLSQWYKNSKHRLEHQFSYISPTLTEILVDNTFTSITLLAFNLSCAEGTECSLKKWCRCVATCHSLIIILADLPI